MIFVLASDSKMDRLGYLPPQIEPFRKKSDRSHVYSLFLGNSNQHMPIYTKIISSWVNKGLDIAKAHISWYALRCYGACSFGGWCFPGVHPTDRQLG